MLYYNGVAPFQIVLHLIAQEVSPPCPERTNSNSYHINMKKTLVTIMALAGVAAADTPTPTAAVNDYTFNTSVITFGSTDTAWSSFAGKINAANSFTLQISLTDWKPANGPLFYLSTKDSESAATYDTSLVTVGYSADGNGLSGWYGAALFNSANGSMRTDTDNTNPGPVNYTYTSASRTELPSHANSSSLEATLFVTANQGTVTLYEVNYDNELVQICSTTNLSAGEAKSIVFSQWSNTTTTNDNNGTISISAYNGVLTTSQMAALIPEPTTATLSLLALAGLAARRRRK